MVIPMGKDMLGFPTLSYLPQYLGLFVLGAIAYRHDWLRTLSTSMGIVGLLVSAMATIVLFPLALSGHLFSLQIAEQAGFVGNGTWQSAVYALWDSTVAVGMCLGVTAVFRRAFARDGWLGRLLSRQSYAVYVIHAPIVVFLAIALRAVQAEALLKFVLGSLLIVPACFVAATIIRRIPGVSRII
jgi:glucan biosynthesis protein C